MSTILEDRLRAHFAEQAAQDVLAEPDPRAALALAALAGPSPTGRGPAGRRRAVRVAVIALAVACLLAVVAVAATRDDGDGDVNDDPRPTTTEPDARPATTERPATTATVPETTTTTPAAAATRSVVVAPLGVLGWWDGQRWIGPDAGVPVPLQGGERYELTRIGRSRVVVTGPAPVRDGCISGEQLMVHLDAFPDGPARTVVGVTGVADIQPRPVTVVDPTAYRDAAVAALASVGIDDPGAEPALVVRTDLDGDGSDEVLMQLERVSDRDSLVPEAGDYSALFLRRVVDGQVRTTAVEHSVADIASEGNGYILVYELVAVADLNGDGRMEVVLQSEYYEGGSTAAYELSAEGLNWTIGVGCGA